MKECSRACRCMRLAAAAVPTAAHSQEEEDSSGISISVTATVVSDFLFRGFSQSNEEAAIQGGFTISHDSGLYIGTWGSSIGFANGTEIDVVGGYSHELVPGLTADNGPTLYLHPGPAEIGRASCREIVCQYL